MKKLLIIVLTLSFSTAAFGFSVSKRKIYKQLKKEVKKMDQAFEHADEIHEDLAHKPENIWVRTQLEKSLFDIPLFRAHVVPEIELHFVKK